MKKGANMDNNRRAVVIGLDGATFDLLSPWVKEGKLPNMKRLIEDGCWGPLRTVVPPSTSSAWTSFATGKNPGKHAIFEFMKLDKETYQLYPANSTSVKTKSLWDILGPTKRSIILNVPMTYPPRHINGLMITCMLTPSDAVDYTYPQDLKGEIDKVLGDYFIYPREAYSRKNINKFINELHFVLDRKIKLAKYLLKKYDWDLFIQVFNETDIIQHGLWHCLDQKHPNYDEKLSGKYKNAILELYKRIDGFLGYVENQIRDEDILILMSDHGAGTLYSFIHTNNWLLKEGFIKPKNNILSRVKFFAFKFGVTPVNTYKILNRLGLGNVKKYKLTTQGYNLVNRFFFSFADIDWKRTEAYAVGGGIAGSIFINLKGRESQGCVLKKDYNNVCEDLVNRLMQLQDKTGERLIGDIIKGEEIFKGKYSKLGPDIIYFPKDPKNAVFSNFSFSSNEIFESVPSHVSAQHRMDGIFIANGKFIKNNLISGAGIMDIAPTILYFMGIPIPKDIDGAVLEEIFEKGFFKSRQISFCDSMTDEYVTETKYSSKEEEIKKRLEGLGYL